MDYRMWAALLLTALLAGCDSAPPGSLQTHVHPNGLRLSVSESSLVTTTTAGFVIEAVAKNRMHYPFVVSVALLTQRPKGRLYRVHYAGDGRILWYSATHDEGVGSGDPAWEMIAVERVGTHWIEYRETRQDEWPPHEMWDIAQRVSYIPPSSR